MSASALPSTGGRGRDPITCDTRGLFMIHTVLRSRLSTAIRLVRGVADGDRERAARVADHVLEVSSELHTHHHGEDVLLWDRLEQRAPACAIHIERMRIDHAEIAALLSAAGDRVPKWRASAAAADRDALVDAIQSVLTRFESHLTGEEKDIEPVVATTMSQREVEELGKHGRAAIPRDQQLARLGAMLDSAGQYRDYLWTSIPPPVRLLYRLFGKRRFEREQAELEGAARP